MRILDSFSPSTMLSWLDRIFVEKHALDVMTFVIVNSSNTFIAAERLDQAVGRH